MCVHTNPHLRAQAGENVLHLSEWQAHAEPSHPQPVCKARNGGELYFKNSAPEGLLMPAFFYFLFWVLFLDFTFFFMSSQPEVTRLEI